MAGLISKAVREQLSFIKRHGYKVTNVTLGGKHLKVSIEGLPRPVIMSKTPSARRSSREVLSHIRKMEAVIA